MIKFKILSKIKYFSFFFKKKPIPKILLIIIKFWVNILQ